MDQVWWSALGRAFKDHTLCNKVWLLKFQYDWLPTAKRMNRIYPQESAMCPVYATEIETWKHMFQFKHGTVCTAQLHMIGKLSTGLKKMKTNCMVKRVLLYKIKQWCWAKTTPPCIPSDELGNLLSDAVADQHKLRWDNLIKGQISKTWGRAQDVHFKVFHADSR
eukprot:5174102-Ditylum_brightwellii.AAC.2